ncbi:MAG: GTP 3',8-cyclase MoaA [bacterium]|nr:GTP 3',8-cyclase MoaA [bacterium]
MIDGCGREIDHLRLSLTERCNMACRYCAPSGQQRAGRQIDAGFAFELVRWLTQCHGIRHVRLTGGEPLLYRGLAPLIGRLAELGTLHELTLTTNGQALAGQAADLCAAGLKRINISLDTLVPERFTRLTRGGDLARTLAGIEAAIRHGLTPVKINVVAQRGLNDGELADMAQWGLSRGCVVRFLEAMPIGPLAGEVDKYLVPASEVLERLAERFVLHPIPQSIGQPATDYVATGQGLRGVIGVIAPTTRPFCASCRRIRITHRGRLVPCLHDERGVDLARWWDGRTLDTRGADGTLSAALQTKPALGPQNQSVTMLSLGG